MMLKKMKDFGGQLSGKAAKAASGMVASIGEGVGNLAGTAGEVASGATDKTVRAAVDQLCNVLEIAVEQLQQRPLPASRMTLTASVGLGATALQMQVVLTEECLALKDTGHREDGPESERRDETLPPG